ncbi:MAG: AAA family ATPase [Candidatus Lokiarchaeota archaeon]|nr:AAA family ATPase [Candidatus Lokiarchaeota archaeon]
MLGNKNFLICLTGLPASGKTTFAKTLKLILEKRFEKLSIRIIDPDIIRNTMTPNNFDYLLEPIVKERNLAEVSAELSKGKIVISDDLNYYSSMRHNLKIIADRFKLNFFIIYISTPFETCLKWNKKRGEPIPNEIVSKIQEKFDDFGKYKWDYPVVEIDISQIKDLNNKVDDLVDELVKKLSFSQKIFKREKIISKSSNWDNQNLDKITRIYVGKLLRNPKLTPLKKKIIKSRKKFVNLYKNKALNEIEIVKAFKKYLEKNLKIRISEEFT